MSISRDEWLKALGDSITPNDPDSLTTAEFAAMVGIGRTLAVKKLAQLVAEGKAVRTSKIIRSGQWATRCLAYKLVKGKK